MDRDSSSQSQPRSSSVSHASSKSKYDPENTIHVESQNLFYSSRVDTRNPLLGKFARTLLLEKKSLKIEARQLNPGYLHVNAQTRATRKRVLS